MGPALATSYLPFAKLTEIGREFHRLIRIRDIKYQQEPGEAANPVQISSPARPVNFKLVGIRNVRVGIDDADVVHQADVVFTILRGERHGIVSI